ncbi:O-antigen ligase [Pseudoduganella flava]|uniref:O-antigen ligase n=1 Tax=Pseudoduganella flava TaxID=871742 RepID=A0A562Q4W8_9BURK|nr:O-antigen ligase family protein [Pseudoduganella flava]QGZ41785.1 polymerase [Pseudoduganella flava]TWI51789.1 O-antigen ligase [Pseudoduganella flava]
MTEILITLIVILVALAAVGCLALAMHWGHKRDHGLVPYIFYPTLAAAAIGIALSARDLSAESDIMSLATGKHPLAVWVSRFASVFVLLACGERILHRMVHLKKAEPPPRLLMFGFWVFVLSNVASPALFGRHPNLSHEYLYMALFGQCALLFSAYDADLTVKSIRNACMLFLLASAAMLLVRPSQVLDFAYHGLIPHLPRYAGLAPHANTLGPLAVVYLLCLWHRPFEKLSVNRAAWALGLGSLLLTQSKTSWISLILASSCIVFYRYRPALAARFGDPRRPALPSFILGGMMVALTIVGVVLMFADVGGTVERMFSSGAGAELASFSGRDAIWAVAKEEFERNPIFGYGLTIWNLQFQIAARLPFAVHAHSQLFQTASSAGTVGLVGLFVYALVLLAMTLRTARASGGLSMALFLILVVRGVSEVPLQMTGFGLDTMTHLLLLVVLTAYSLPHAKASWAQAKTRKQQQPAVAPAAAPVVAQIS